MKNELKSSKWDNSIDENKNNAQKIQSVIGKASFRDAVYCL